MSPHPTHIPYVVKVVPPRVVQYGGLAQRLIRTAHVLQQRHAGALDHAAGQQAGKALQEKVLCMGNKGGEQDGVEKKGGQMDSSGEVVAGLSGAAAELCVQAIEVEGVGRGKGEREEMCLAWEGDGENAGRMREGWVCSRRGGNRGRTAQQGVPLPASSPAISITLPNHPHPPHTANHRLR